MPARVRQRDISAAMRKWLRLLGTAARKERVQDMRSAAIPRSNRGIVRNLWKRRRVVRDEDGQLSLRMSTTSIPRAYHGQLSQRVPPVELSVDRAFNSAKPLAAYDQLVNLIETSLQQELTDILSNFRPTSEVKLTTRGRGAVS